MPLTLRLLLCATLAYLGAACCLFEAPAIQLEVKTVAGMNDNAPVGVELVLFFDEDLFSQAQAMTAKEWFGEAGRRFKQRQDAGKRTYDIHRWEWVPGQRVEPAAIPLPGRTLGAVLYADYPTLGAHREVIEDPEGLFRLDLESSGFSLEAEDESSI